MASNGAIANGSNGESKEKKPFSRLPSNVQPIHYEVFLKPDLKDLSFVGNMNVTLSVTQATDTIVCNAADLSVIDVQVNGKATNGVVLSKDTETMTVRLNAPLQEQSQVALSCKFKGELNDMMRGINQYNSLSDKILRTPTPPSPLTPYFPQLLIYNYYHL